MAGVGSALGQAFDNKSLFLDITFSWQPVATIRDRPVTLLDAQLEGTKLTVLDAAKWVTGGKVVCPAATSMMTFATKASTPTPRAPREMEAMRIPCILSARSAIAGPVRSTGSIIEKGWPSYLQEFAVSSQWRGQRRAWLGAALCGAGVSVAGRRSAVPAALQCI